MTKTHRRSHDEIRTELQAEAARMIDELMAWQAATPTPNLTQIEDAVLKVRQRLSERMAELLIESQEAVRPGITPRCPQCQGKLRFKDEQPRTVESRTGKLEVARAYYYCPHCQAGFFPPRSTT
jgi:hypothetical protein